MTKPRTLATVAVLFAFCLISQLVHAQQVDVAFGISGVSTLNGNKQPDPVFGVPLPQVGGGAFPVVSADFLWAKGFGVGGNVAWRAKQNLYYGFQPFRPIFYDFDAVWAPKVGRVQLQLEGGGGALSTRFYSSQYTCTAFSCSNYQSTNHGMLHVGAGLRLYVTHSIFVRPEVHQYFIHNGNAEFNGGKVSRIGISIGYSLLPSNP